MHKTLLNNTLVPVVYINDKKYYFAHSIAKIIGTPYRYFVSVVRENKYLFPKNSVTNTKSETDTVLDQIDFDDETVNFSKKSVIGGTMLLNHQALMISCNLFTHHNSFILLNSLYNEDCSTTKTSTILRVETEKFGTVKIDISDFMTELEKLIRKGSTK